MCIFEVIGTILRSKPDSDAITAKLAEIKDKRITRFEPIIRPEGGLTYTGFSDHDFARQLDLLKTLQSLGIVKEEAFDHIRKCGRCGHHGLLLKVSCPACGSTNTDLGKVIEHLPCGNIDLESKFISEDGGGLICVKCKKRLRAIGVDYVKPGSYCMCLSCNALSPEGKAQFVCLNCASTLSMDDVESEPLHAYSVDPEALSSHLDRSNQEFQLSIVKALEKLGVKATPGGTVVGSSQVQHVFDIVAYQSDSPEPALAVEIEKSDNPVGSELVLNFFAKSMDSKVPRSILIGIPSISEEAKKLANAYGITALESDGSNPEELAGRLAASVAEKDELPGPDDSQLAEMLQSIVGVVQEEAAGGTSDVDRVNLEKMLKTIISAAQDDESDKGVS
ncbi:MAG: restriction endonuclease [Nitrososphaera sp.]|nr:restriction endonuclease [Nitrososphaera sp.]